MHLTFNKPTWLVMVTLEQYIKSYVKLGKMFNSDVESPERLDRRNVKTLLPNSSSLKVERIRWKKAPS